MDETTRRVRELLRQGQKVEAVKLLRDATGMGLKEAAEEVDRLGAGEGPVASATPRRVGYDDVSDEVRRLATSGRKIEAVKLLRTEAGLGLKEARERVERIPGSRRSGCAGSVALLALASGALTLLLLGT